MDSLGERYFDALRAEENLREEVWEALFNAVGYAYPGELGDLPGGSRGFVPPWPLQDITFDPYDSSFGFKGCTVDWEPTPEQLQACLDLGFERAWVCWLDGTERYYGHGVVGERRPRR